MNAGAIDENVEDKLREINSRLAELERAQQSRVNGLLLIIFSGQMDRLLAAFSFTGGAKSLFQKGPI